MSETRDNGPIGSLFTGYGGLDLGVMAALGGSMDVAWTSDIEPGPTAIEERHAPACGCPPNLGDITKIDMAGLKGADVVCGGSPCFPAGALVLTDRGFTPIEEVRVGDLALTHLGRWRRVTAVGSHIGDTVVLRGQGSPGIECTPNHPFWSGRRIRGPWDNGNRTYHTLFEETGWTPAADMAGRMWLNAGGGVPALPIPMLEGVAFDERFFYFVGRWLGDGWLYADPQGRGAHVGVCCGFKDEDSLRPHIDALGWKFGEQDQRTGHYWRTYGRPKYDWFRSNFGRGAADNTIPAWAFGMPESWRRALLRGYWESDGNPTSKGAHATSVSKRLLLGIKMLEAGLGRPSGLSRHEPNRRCVIEGRVVNERTLYTLESYDHPRKSIVCDTGYWGACRKVEPGRTGVRVWDLTVEEDHSFTVDGICVRNCQSMSLAGLRAGMHHGTRSGLWSYQTDVVAAVRPALMVWENVSGALSATASSREDLAEADRRAAALKAAGLCACETPSIDPPVGFTPPDPDAEGSQPLATTLRAFLKGDAARLAAIRCSECGRPPYQMRAGHALADGERLDGAHTAPTIRALGRVLGDLANLGYDAVWRGIEAADVGAPHRRLRIFVAAWPHDPGTARTPANPRLARLAALPPMRPDGLPWAVWDADRDVWTEPADDLFGERAVFMDAWPRSGVMAAGAVYRAPTSAGAGGGPVPSATPDTMDGMPSHGDAAPCARRDDIRSLPTPAASDAVKHGPSDADRLRADPVKRSIHLCDEIATNVGVSGLLSTPRASDGVKGGPNQSFGSGGTPLAAQAAMLPTPSALYDSEKAGTPADARRRRDRAPN